MQRLIGVTFLLASLGPNLASADEDPAEVTEEGERDGDSAPLSIYGFARLDILADDSRMSDIYQPRYVMPEPDGGAVDGELTMTPRLSRFGLSIDEWNLGAGGNLRGEGKIEVDFGGGGGVNTVRLRHAYAQVNLATKVELLAGQTWDLISPLFPSAQSDTQLLCAGNTGDRRPQLRLTVLPTDKVRFAIAAAATATLDQRDMAADSQHGGIATSTPMVQGLIEVRTRLTRRGAPARLGIWGHASNDELANGTTYPSRSLGGHVFLPIATRVVAIGEVYAGSNAADIGGGIGQGVNLVADKVIHAWGGWGELAFIPSNHYMFVMGGSGDVARTSDVEVGDRTSNRTLYTTLRYKPKPSLQLGFEYLNWKTLYKGMSSGLANRFDVHLSVYF